MARGKNRVTFFLGEGVSRGWPLRKRALISHDAFTRGSQPHPQGAVGHGQNSFGCRCYGCIRISACIGVGDWCVGFAFGDPPPIGTFGDTCFGAGMRAAGTRSDGLVDQVNEVDAILLRKSSVPVAFVRPDRLGFFSQHQQRCRFG